MTGNFDAVLQIAISRLNGLLAGLHQKGDAAGTPLKLLHSVRVRIGDPPSGPPEVSTFGEWVAAYAHVRRAMPLRPVRDELVATSPPGTSRRIEANLDQLEVLPVPPPPVVVRGTATVQLSTVRVSIPQGSTSEVAVRADVRAHYEADSGTTPLPEYVHGEVRAVFEVRREVSGAKTRLVIRPSTDDAKIEFEAASGSGISGADAARIAAQVRKALRENLILQPVDLPDGFPFADFKGVGSGANAAVALPLQLSGAPPPPGGIQTLTQSFVGTSGFAFAVSRAFVESLVDVDAIRDTIEQQEINPFGGVTYRLRFTEGPALTFQSGTIEISGKVRAETGTWWAPNGSVGFKQLVTLVLNVPTQQVDLVLVGDPDVSVSWRLRLFLGKSRARDLVKSEIGRALDDLRPAVQGVFDDGRSNLVDALRTFEPSASASYTQIEVASHGVTIRGEVSSPGRIPPVVHIDEAGPGGPFTAFRSWIPGGWIDRFTWSWVEYPQDPLLLAVPWSGVVKTATETHRFLLEKPPGIHAIDRICLRIRGTRTLPDGSSQAVFGGTTCEIAEPVLAFDAPSWWEPVTVPLWLPDVPDDAPLRDAVAGHVGLQSDRPTRGLRQNALVFFPDWTSDTPFDALVQGLKIRRRRQVAPAVFVVLPSAAFDASRRKLEARLGAFSAGMGAHAHVAEDAATGSNGSRLAGPPMAVYVTEDVKSGWSHTFAVGSTPALFLINARREFVWQAEGEPDPARIAAALDEHLVAAPPSRFRPLRLRVAVGERAPDVIFRDDRGEEKALHRLRGRTVVFTFWQSWSAPCLAELRRLQAIEDAYARDAAQAEDTYARDAAQAGVPRPPQAKPDANPGGAPFIVAFHGGPARANFDDVRREHGLTFSVVQDDEHRVAGRFGVRCWPTTITINPDGRIEHVQLGIEPEIERGERA